MNNIEQEYSFKVTNIKPFLKYCKNNDFKKIEKTEQVRTLYKKPDKTMLRLTIKKCGRKIVKEMDFKQDKLSSNAFVERKESLPLLYQDDEAINSIIDFLGYKKDVELIRTRYVYCKEDIKIEIDEYVSPNVMFVVAIEGNIKKTTKIYNEFKEKYNKYFLFED
jgi:adenylate cyclase class IV